MKITIIFHGSNTSNKAKKAKFRQTQLALVSPPSTSTLHHTHFTSITYVGDQPVQQLPPIIPHITIIIITFIFILKETA